MNSKQSLLQNARPKLYKIIVLGSLAFLFIINALYLPDNGVDSNPENQGTITSYTSKEWLKNTGFTGTVAPWFNSTEGDLNDVNASYNADEAQIIISGKKANFSTSGVESYPNASGEWRTVHNPNFPVWPVQDPDFPLKPSIGVDQYGWWTNHRWDQNIAGMETQNTPSVWWKRNYTLSENLADYSITSISIDAVVNATVRATDGGNGVDVPGDKNVVYSVGDYARFYLMVENVEGTHRYELMFNQTSDLGDDDRAVGGANNGIDTLSNVHLIPSVTEEIMKAYLSAIFQNTIYNKFSIILAIDIYDEDNIQTDGDIWKDLRFSNFTFNFAYERKMNRNTAVTWNQIGDKINGTGIQVEEAKANFRFKINDTWSQELSPNSELQVLINSNEHTESIKLWKLNSSWQNSISYGTFDVTPLVVKNVNITFGVRAIIRDNFDLNRSYAISIDDASLNITYSVTSSGNVTDYRLYLNEQDQTAYRTLNLKFGTQLNVTFQYLNNGSNFIPDASVNILVGGIERALTQDISLGHYNITIDTSTLVIGSNYLTLTAIKTNYDSISIIITVNVIALDTTLQFFVNTQNRTLEKSVDVVYGESFNISVRFNKTEGSVNEFIEDATVQLLGLSETLNLTQDIIANQYFTTIDSSTLGLGIKYLTITAQKQNFTSQSIVIKVDVGLRSGFMSHININGTERLTFEIDYNRLFNITVFHNDSLTNLSLTGSSLKLEATGYSLNLIEFGELTYLATLNSSDLGIGITYLTLTANRANYSIVSQILVITVIPKTSAIDLYLSSDGFTVNYGLEVKLGAFVNISLNYRDAINNASINPASVSLEGFGPSRPMEFQANLYQFQLDTNQLSVGIFLFSLVAYSNTYAQKSLQFTITIKQRDSIMTLYLNDTDSTLSRAITVELEQYANISVTYYDEISLGIISPAIVNMTGLSSLPTSLSLENSHYFYLIDTLNLGVGIFIFTLTASALNHSQQSIVFTVTVNPRSADIRLYLNGTDSTITRQMTIPVQSLVNITILYFDTKKLTTISTGSANLTYQSQSSQMTFINGYYHYLLDTYNMNVGSYNILLVVSEENHTLQSISFTINIIQRSAGLSLFVNNTDISVSKLYSGQIDMWVNVSVNYFDILQSELINPASINLTGLGMNPIPLSFFNGIYQVHFDTSTMLTGSYSLTITAAAENYTLSSIVWTLTINQHFSKLNLFLNGQNKTLLRTIEVSLESTLNISIAYSDLYSDTLITPASVNLTGFGPEIIQIPYANSWYQTILDTSTLTGGSFILEITAVSNNFTLQTIIFTLVITLRASNLHLFLNQNNATSNKYLAVQLGANINVSANFFDPVRSTILFASLNLTSSHEPIVFSYINGIYQISLDSYLFGVGSFSLTIQCSHVNYTSQSITFVLIISQRTSDIHIFFDQNNSTNVRYLEVDLESEVNVSIFYFDYFNHNLINYASVNITGVDSFSDTLLLHNGMYQGKINTATLGIGTFSLTISAASENHTFQQIQFTLVIRQRLSGLSLYLNGVNATLTKFISVQLGTPVNVSVFYFDQYEMYLISSATVSVTPQGLSAIILNPIDGLYQSPISTIALGVGTFSLSISAQSNNYSANSIVFTIIVNPIATSLNLFIQGENMTIARAVTVPLRTIISIELDYFEIGTSATISSAVLTLTGLNSGLVTLAFQNGKYYYSINVSSLGLGIHFFSILAGKDGYSQNSLSLTITVIQIPTNISLASGSNTLLTKPGEKFTVDITLEDKVSHELIRGANVTYTWEFGTGTLFDSDGDGHYTMDSIIANPGLYTLYITAYKGIEYDFEQYQVIVSVINPEATDSTGIIITLVVSLAIGFTAFMLYNFYFKYPKMVRKLRNLRRNLRKNKPSQLKVKDASTIVGEKYNEMVKNVLKTIPRDEKVHFAKNDIKKPLDDSKSADIAKE